MDFFHAICLVKPLFQSRRFHPNRDPRRLLIDHRCDWHESLGFRGLGGIQDLRGRVALAVALQEEL